MKSKIMVIAFSIAGLLILILVIGRVHLSSQFHKEVRQLFSQSKSISNQAFNYSELIGLPEPVQRYFKHVLKDGQPYISYVRITHDGQFKTGFDKDWINIKGEQYATTEKPGFIWKGTTTMFVARDMYIADEGRLIVSLFSVYKIADAQGEKYNQGELLRWLGESILYPTNLLPGERLEWLPVDAETAKLVFHYKGLSLFFIMKFNTIGEIVSMESKRYMDKNHSETWVIKPDAYEERNGIIVPLRFEVLWRLAKGDFSYVKFNIQKIEYNDPRIF
jgi:hypothetical protein